MKKLQEEIWYEKIYAWIVSFLTKNRNNKGSRNSLTKESDAVSSVVALMLILAVVATFLSIYSTSYIPGLKEQSEIAQTTTVKESFIQFSGDIEHIVMKKTPASCGNMIPLGAGDILFSPEKSSGTLTVTNASKNGEALVEIYTGSGKRTESHIVNVAFSPFHTFWEGQGYTWQYGYINVTKKNKEVPLTKFNMEGVLDDEKFSTFAKSFVTFEDKGKIDTISGENKLSNLTINMVNIVPGGSSFISGNSPTNLGIVTDVRDVERVDTHHLDIYCYNNSAENPVMSEFSACLADGIISSLNGLHKTYCKTAPLPKITPVDYGFDKITFDIDDTDPDMEVIIRQITITVSAS